MPPKPFRQLSDEPLYCEAVHDRDDDGFYSGSEDDHYEDPLHRRLHIEKKAVDFLSGNVPILMSAALRGPFDRNQWNNPWRSTRADSHAEPCEVQPTESRQTAVAEEDLPDTQGTSLYPLPSPETTNPPSAKKNPYMDEQDYNRVKTWREAVKSTSAFKDVFWKSQQALKDETSGTRKRSADSTWLHKRERKKPRSANPRDSSSDDSPSRGAAPSRGSQARQLHASQMVAQFLRNSSPPEDELAKDGHTRPSRSNTPHTANKNLGMTPHRARLYFKAPDTSEDELSMPATTPTSKAVRTYIMVSRSPTRDRSPNRRRKTTNSKSRPSRGRGNSSRAREKAKESPVSQPSTSQGPDHDEARAASHAVDQIAEVALACTDVSPQNLLTKQSERFQDQLLLGSPSAANQMISPQTFTALTSTQQDNSFLFHKIARSPAGRIEGGRSTGVPDTRGVLSQSSLQFHATKTKEELNQSSPGDDPAARSVPGPESMMRKNRQGDQHCPVESPRESRDPDLSPAMDEGCLSSRKQPDRQTQCTDGKKTNDGTTMADGFISKVEPDTINDCAEVVQLKNTNEHRVPEECQSLSQGRVCSQSDSQWSTYLDSENRTLASSSEQETTKKSDDILVEFGVDGPSDPERSIFVNTQDIRPVIPELEAGVDPEEVVTNEQVGTGQTTLANAECLLPVSVDAADMADETGQAACFAVCSPGLAAHTGEASEDSNPGTFSQDQTHSQSSVGSIIDAYAEIIAQPNSSEPSTIENPGAEYAETEADVFASPCSLPNQTATVSMDESEVYTEGISTEKPQQLQTALLESDATESLVGPTCGPSKSDETTACAETRSFEDVSGLALQTSRISEGNATCSSGSSSVDEPSTGPEEPKLQSPCGQKAADHSQMPSQAPSNETKTGSHSGGLNEAAAQVQSPWNKSVDMTSPLFAPLMTSTSLAGSTPDLSSLAGKALAMSQLPQSPWGPQTTAAPTPHAQDFEMSIRAFSEFMSPSPVKKRASSSGRTFRGSSAGPGILFKTHAQRKLDRRVHFAALPGEEETCFTEFDPDEKDAIYDEEDVSYFDLSGRKTSTVRMPRPTMRTASPPPLDMSSVEVAGLPDHDQKFARHFEAMSMRKKPSRKSLRLLPSESQQTATASPEVGAMAEAFVQASQTRKKGLQLAAEKRAEATCRSEYVNKTSVPVTMDIFEDQENVEPMDDVSLVLDNLDKFLDNTWGIDMGTGESPANDARSKQQEGGSGQHALQKVEDPMHALETNVWAE